MTEAQLTYLSITMRALDEALAEIRTASELSLPTRS